jgi:hypothetical protein
MKFSSLINVSVSGLVMCLSSVCSAYDYHPNARLYLGGGFNPEHIDQGYAAGCLEGYTTESDMIGAGPATVQIKYVRSESEIQRAMGVSVSASASYLFASGQMTTQLTNESAFQSDSITFVIYATQHYGREYILNPKINSQLNHLSPDQLLSRCGPEVVTEQTRGVSVIGVFTLSNLTQADRTAFETTVGGGLNGGIFSAQVEASLRTFLSNISSVLNISSAVYTIGGQGITELRNLLPAEDQGIARAISDAPNTIRNYMETMTKENSVPISFTTMRLGQLVEANVPAQAGFDVPRLTRAYERYLGVHNTVVRLERILYEHDPVYVEPVGDDRERLLNNLDAYADARNNLEVEGRVCFGPLANRSACQINRIMRSLPIIQWPARVQADPAMETELPIIPPTPPTTDFTPGFYQAYDCVGLFMEDGTYGRVYDQKIHQLYTGSKTINRVSPEEYDRMAKSRKCLTQGNAKYHPEFRGHFGLL